jgi:hypothetical protein
MGTAAISTLTVDALAKRNMSFALSTGNSMHGREIGGRPAGNPRTSIWCVSAWLLPAAQSPPNLKSAIPGERALQQFNCPG